MKLSKANVCARRYCAFFLIRGRIRKNECPNFASVRTESFQVDLGDCPADVLREKSESYGSVQFLDVDSQGNCPEV